MKVLPQSTIVLVFTEARCPDHGSSSTVPCPLKKSVSQKYLSTWWRIITKCFPNLFASIGSTIPSLTQSHKIARDYSSPFLWCCDETYIYTNHNTTICIYASKFKLGLKVEEQCSCHLIMASVLQYSQLSHYKINLIALLAHHVATSYCHVHEVTVDGILDWILDWPL